VENVDCLTSKQGLSYVGHANTTVSGRTCRHWSDQMFIWNDVEENFCRNPDGDKTVWCFTTDPDTLWEFCDVKECNDCKVATNPNDVIFNEEEILSSNSSRKGLPLGRIMNPDLYGQLPNQVYFRGCTGTMLTSTIVLTAGHCVDDLRSPADVVVYPPERKCGEERGIKACKVEFQLKGRPGAEDGRDIALIRLSSPMNIHRNIELPFESPVDGQRTIMAGTGKNNINTCRSLLSYQTVEWTERPWYYTKGTYQTVSGTCRGDSGGPDWTFGVGLTGVTSGAPLDDTGCTTGYTVFSNIAFYQEWIKKTMDDFDTC